MALWRVGVDGEERLAVGDADTGPTSLLDTNIDLDGLLASATNFLSYRQAPTLEMSGEAKVLVPLGSQEVWASGVTYEESRYAREHESTAPDFYRDVYYAERPELFLKAVPGTSVGPGEAIGVRNDSEWNVPEPELAIVMDPHGEIVALTLGNDVSSRSIEGRNPLYLPQAKVYDRSCAVGPCLVPIDEAPPIQDIVVDMRIVRSGTNVFSGSSPLVRLRRKTSDLVAWLMKARSFTNGAVLLTGTGLVPPNDFTLHPGDIVHISADGLGDLTNRVEVVGNERMGGGPS